MKILKISLIVLALMAVLLMASSPASAKTTRIYFYQVGGDECMPVLDPPHISGPNVHLHGTYTCPTVAYDMDDNPFPMFTGVITWTDAKAQMVGEREILSSKIRIDTVEGGAWVGSFSWPATGVLKGVYHGEGIYEGMTVHGTFDPEIGFNGGYVQFNQK